ncbi:MAG: hypothetical protein SFW35_06495 [Chitinophagales bacterium]|nr:hypothetical protein [Chitinophagales bacterium]
MKSLSSNWLTEGRIDFEYKKYLLLAYLQEVGNNFNEHKLYPFLADLFQHHNNLLALKQGKESAMSAFPKQISKIDIENMRLEYEKLHFDDRYLEELNSIMDYALPRLKKYTAEGKELYDFVEEQLLLSPVGVMPLNPKEGYLLLREAIRRDIKVYEYSISIFEQANEQYRGVRTQYVTSYTSNAINTFEHIKYDLIKKRRQLANPATYAIESKALFPFEETFYPIARRLLMRHLSEQVA